MRRNAYSVSIHKSHRGTDDHEVTASIEYVLNWRTIIFIPFGEYWQFVLNASIVINSFWLIYLLAYKMSDRDIHTEWFHYCLEILFLLDTLLLITHRNMPRFRRIRDHAPKAVISLTFDVITLLPIYEVYFLLLYVSGREDSMNFAFRQVVRIKSALRLYRVYLYTIKMKSQAGRNQILIIWLSHFVTVTLVVHVLGALWYNMACWKCKEDWTEKLEGHIFDPSSIKDWFIISFTNIGIAFQHCDRGVLSAVTWEEEIVIMLTMLLGYFNHMIYFFGQLTIGRIKQFRRQQEYSRRINQIKMALDEWNINKEIKDKTMQYYSTLWNKRSGIRNMPICFKLLPTPMQKEVMVDIFWEALRHSTLFSDVDVPFKRAIGLFMESEFYLPGDFVFKSDHYKTKMIYIVSGILQIISDEDEESSVLSFSAGTVLGEASLIYPTKSKTNVRCATNCELHTLSMPNLAKALHVYPEGIDHMRHIIQERIEFAKDLLAVKEMKALEKENSEYGNSDDNSILWMKARWRQLYEIKTRKRTVDFERLRTLTDVQHTSMNLGLLALSEDVELKIKAICLKGQCPYIFEPNSTFRIFCDALILLAVAVQSLVLPYYISFERRTPYEFKAVMFVFDCIYFFDIYLQLSTAIKGRVHTVTTISSIIVYKFKEVSFLIDLIAALPFDYIANAMDVTEHIKALLKINRMLKLHKLIAFMKMREKDFRVNYLKVQLVKYILLYVIIIYWCNCFLYSVACFNEECYEYGWFKYNLKRLVEAGYIHDPDKFVFIRALLYTISILFSLKQSAIIEWVTHEKLIMFILLNIAYYVYSFCFSELCATMVMNNQHRLNYKDYIRSMNAYLIKNQVDTNLRRRVANLLHFRWEYNENVTVLGENGVMNDAPSDIKDKVVLKRIMKRLYNTPLFQDCDEEFVHSIAADVVLKTLPEDAVVTTADVQSSWIHVILRGYCNLQSTMAGDKERNSTTVLKPGDAFPIVETLNQVLVLANVTTVTAVELISIKLTNLHESLGRFPHEKVQFFSTLETHRSQFETQLLRKKGRLPEMIPSTKSLGQGELFEYKIYDKQETSREMQEYATPFARLGRLKIIRYIFQKMTVNPKGRFFITWEIIRLSLSAIVTLMIIGFDSIFIYIREELFIFFRIVDTIMVIDLYIRIHCQYYNENGILVTHPWSTMKHYFSTSFTIDLISCFPVNFFRIHYIFGAQNADFVRIFLRVFLKPLQMHRFFSLLTYIQSNIDNHKSIIVQGIKYSVLVFIVVGISSVVLTLHVCTVTPGEGISCRENKWINNNHFRDKLNPNIIFLLAITLPFNFFSLTGGFFLLTDIDEILFCLPIVFLLYLLRWYFLAKLTSCKIGGNLNLTIFHEQVENFQQFMKKELIDEDLVALTIENYQYVWKKTQGTEVSKTLSGFHAHLHEDLGFDLYSNTFKRTEFFCDADNSFFRLMGVQVREMYFKKDAEIIRCNDVQGLIYIVYKGRVDISVAKMKLCTMDNGGMFGSFKGKAKTRQTITAVAKVHVGVLAVDGIEFYKIVSQYPAILMKVKHASYLNAEFVEPQGGSIHTKTSEESTSGGMSMVSTTSVLSFLKKITLSHILISETNKRYRVFNYLVSVHFSTLSSLWYSFVVVMLPMEDKASRWATLITAIFIDLIFVGKMFVESHKTYIEPESGILITDKSLIRKRYFLSLQRFWFDLFTVFPMNIVILLYTDDQYTKYGYINRIFRWFYLIMYYRKEEYDLNVKQHLRWTYLIYVMIMNIQTAACIWFLVACDENYRCYYNKSRFDSNDITITVARTVQRSILLTYNHVVNIMTTNGVSTTLPVNLLELATTLIIAIIFIYATIRLISGFTTIMAISSYSMGNYEYNIEELRIYLQDRDLSPFILGKVWKYCLQLWHRQRGEWMPSLVTEAPPYIRQDIMLSLYGYHIESHFLFTKTHVDFIRQLVVHLKRCVFFPGNFLAEKGDVDSCMFFIHDGEVDVLDVNGENVIPREVLRKGRSFGEASGLFNSPHEYSYKAHTVVDALLLIYSDWEYLLKWFPASKEEIHEKAGQFNIRKSRDL